jgi:hypothetical protein
VCRSFCSNFLWLWIGYDFWLMTMWWCCQSRGMWDAEREDLCHWHCSAWNSHLWSRCGASSCRSRIWIVSWGHCKQFSQMKPFKHMDAVAANFFLRAHCNIIACTSYMQSKCNRCQTFTQCIWFSLVNEPHDPFPIWSHFLLIHVWTLQMEISLAIIRFSNLITLHNLWSACASSSGKWNVRNQFQDG